MLKISSKSLNVSYVFLLIPAFIFFSFSLLSLGSISKEEIGSDISFVFVLYNSIAILPLTIFALVLNNLDKMKVKIPHNLELLKSLVLVLPLITFLVSVIYLLFSN